MPQAAPSLTRRHALFGAVPALAVAGILATGAVAAATSTVNPDLKGRWAEFVATYGGVRPNERDQFLQTVSHAMAAGLDPDDITAIQHLHPEQSRAPLLYFHKLDGPGDHLVASTTGVETFGKSFV